MCCKKIALINFYHLLLHDYHCNKYNCLVTWCWSCNIVMYFNTINSNPKLSSIICTSCTLCWLYISMCNRHGAHKPNLGFSLPLLLMLYCFNHWNLWVTSVTAGLMLVALAVVSFHQPMGQPGLAAVFWRWSFDFNEVSFHSLTNLKSTWGETVILLCNIRN